MVDSVRIKEIHACLGAGEFAYQDNGSNPVPAYMNIARKLDYLCKIWGLYYDLAGNPIDTRLPTHIESGGDIPGGWEFYGFGLNTGGMPTGQKGGLPDEERLGIVYKVNSNFVINDRSGEPVEIREGGYILCESYVQFMEVMLADLNKALDWQNLGGGLMSFNGKTSVNEGLFDILQEISIVGADTNQTTEQTRISSLVTQQLAKEILKALGLPSVVKKINFKLQNQDTSGKTVATVAEIPYNGVADQSPTMVSFFATVLENIAMGNIGKLQINDQEAIKQNPPQEADKEIVQTAKDGFLNAIQVIQDWIKNPTITRKP